MWLIKVHAYEEAKSKFIKMSRHISSEFVKEDDDDKSDDIMERMGHIQQQKQYPKERLGVYWVCDAVFFTENVAMCWAINSKKLDTKSKQETIFLSSRFGDSAKATGFEQTCHTNYGM